MAENAASPELLRKVAALNKTRARTWERIAAGSPGMSADIMGGMTVSEAVKRHFPRQTISMSGQDYAKLKSKMISDLNDYKSQEAERKLAQAEGREAKISGRKKSSLESAMNFLSAADKHAGIDAAAYRKDLLNLTEQRKESLRNEAGLGELTGVSIPKEIRDGIVSAAAPGDQPSIDHLNAVTQWIEMGLAEGQGEDFQIIPGAPEHSKWEGVKKIMALEEAYKGYSGEGVFPSIFTKLKKKMQDKLPEVFQSWYDKTRELDKEVSKQLMYSRFGASNAEKIISLATALEEFYDNEGGKTPEEQEGELDGILASALGEEPGTIAPIDEQEALIEEFEKPVVANNLREARDLLISSPQFQAFMVQNGFEPGLPASELQALRTLRTMLRQHATSVRMKGADTRAQLERGLPEPTESAQLAGAPEGAEADAMQEEITLERAIEEPDRYEVVFEPGTADLDKREVTISLLIHDKKTGSIKSFDSTWNEIPNEFVRIWYEQKQESEKAEALWGKLQKKVETAGTAETAETPSPSPSTPSTPEKKKFSLHGTALDAKAAVRKTLERMVSPVGGQKYDQERTQKEAEEQAARLEKERDLAKLVERGALEQGALELPDSAAPWKRIAEGYGEMRSKERSAKERAKEKLKKDSLFAP